MNALLRPPELARGTVLLAVEDGRDSLLKLADEFDVEPSSFPLRRIVRELEDAGLIRVVERAGDWDLTVVTSRRKAKR